MKNLFVSFSGGETSGLMARLCNTRWRSRYDKIVNIFSNTGEENEQTLEFVNRCDKAFGLNVVWVESVISPEKGVGTKHRIVDFESASRNGEPFEAMIRKYGIPNVDNPHCTRELKQAAMYSYIRSIGWKPDDYDVAIGIRADEPKRLKNRKQGFVYPLFDWMPSTKRDVNEFWRDQPFRLELAGYQGNCKTCWKKSTRKLLTIMDENPGAFDFFERMEDQYKTVGPEFSHLQDYPEGYRRTFLRNYVTIKELRQMHADGGWERAENDAVVYGGKQLRLDVDDGCVESCEVTF